MERILIVEDDRMLNEGLVMSLSMDYACEGVYTCEEGRLQVLKNNYDLLILDVNLPDGSGIDLCGWVKERRPSQKVMFLSANDTESAILDGLAYGAEDYMTKPFSTPILKAKINVILRRMATDIQQDMYIQGHLKVDMGKQEVWVREEQIKVTATEYKLLKLFIDNSRQVLTRAAILEKLWDAHGNYVDENALSVNIRRLRQKIEENPSKPTLIKTVFGIGYTWGA